MNEKMGYSYTEILDKDAIDYVVNKCKRNALAIENDDMQFIYDGDKEYTEVTTYSEDLENIPADKLIKLAMEMEKECKK